MITNAIHAISTDGVELRESGTSADLRFTPVDKISTDTSIGEFLELNDKALNYFYLLNLGSLYRVSFHEASVSARIFMVLLGLALSVLSAVMILIVIANIEHSKPMDCLIPIAVLFMLLMVVPVKLATQRRFGQACRLPLDTMRKVIWYSFIANIIGAVGCFFNLLLLVFFVVFFVATGSVGFVFAFGVFLLMFADLLVVVTSISWISFLIIHDSYIVHSQIIMLRQLVVNGQLTGKRYMEHYRLNKDVNSGHRIRESLVLIGYYNIFSFITIVFLTVGGSSAWGVFGLAILLGREACLVLYLLPFFASTNECFQELQDQCVESLADDEPMPLLSQNGDGESDGNYLSVAALSDRARRNEPYLSKLGVYALMRRFPTTLTLFGVSLSKTSMKAQVYGSIVAAAVGIIKILVEADP